MQIPAKDRESIIGVVDLKSLGYDVSDIPMLTVSLAVHSIGGTSPDLGFTLETSDNLEDWVDVGSRVSRSTAGVTVTAYQALNTPWGRYIRAEINQTGTDPQSVYSLWINTFPSS